MISRTANRRVISRSLQNVLNVLPRKALGMKEKKENREIELNLLAMKNLF